MIFGIVLVYLQFILERSPFLFPHSAIQHNADIVKTLTAVINFSSRKRFKSTHHRESTSAFI